MTSRERLQQITGPVDSESICAAVADAKRGDPEGRLKLCAVMAWVAYSCPEATNAVCDNIASAWLSCGPTPDVPPGLPQAPITDSFWKAFWAVVDGPDEGYDALTITVAVASLGAALHPDFGEIANDHAGKHPGAGAALTHAIPGHTDMAALGNCPKNSLGQSLHQMIIENGYDPEVLDRNSLALSELPHSLHYLNARILQMHDVWHLVAGYDTTSSNEIAISAFQLAQFGHNYSSMFLAAVMSISTFKEPRGFTLLMQIITEAWQHGRETPVMMDIEWENHWNNSLEEIRSAHDIPTYQSIFPANMLELIEAGSFFKKMAILYKIVKYNRQLKQHAGYAAQS
jgi:ubiquinone biosynthesis protein Coq4